MTILVMPAYVMDNTLMSKKLEDLFAIFCLEYLDNCLVRGYRTSSCEVESIGGELDSETTELSCR